MGSIGPDFICGKGKEKYLTRAIVEPKKNNLGYKTWKLENSKVMSWLINYMTKALGEDFTYYGTAKEIFYASSKTYPDFDNTSAFFEIKGILHDFGQEDSIVIEYFNTLMRYWQKLDIYEELA